MVTGFLAISIGASFSVNVTAQATGDHYTYLPLVIRMSNEPISFGPVHSGNATYYNATGDGNCSFGPSPNDLMVGAMNEVEYDNSAICGAYVSITGPKDTIIIRIVDRCPECPVGHIDLSQEAFAQIAELSQGIVPITWQLVSPVLDEPIVYHFKDGSNPWWTAVQIRNHRNPIAKVEYLTGGVFVEVPRLQYNYFVEASGMGQIPYTLRVTDLFGNQIVDSDIPAWLDNADFASQSQFPPPP